MQYSSLEQAVLLILVVLLLENVTIWNKEDAEITIYGAINSSTGFYEISNENSEFGIENASINASYIKSPYVFDKWATTAVRDMAVINSARNMLSLIHIS